MTWLRRGFEAADLDDTWYVVAATDDAEVNERVSAAAEERRIFCVRADDATKATAWTPAVGSRCRGDRRRARQPRAPTFRGGARRDPGRAARGHDQPRVTSAATTPGVTLVGGGPGDPDLISIAGRKALMEADVVVADRLAPRELLGELPPDVELIDVAKLPRGRSAQQDEINRLIVERALAGKRVARFKGGDNFVFGRGFEEVIACREAGVAGHRDPRPDQPGRGPGGRRHPGHPPRCRPRVHRDLRSPAARAPRVADRLGRRRAAARHAWC